jgi:hypothetical protein
MKFPENSPNLVCIPSNEKGTGFMRTCYVPEILDGIMSKDEFMKVIDDASKIVANCYTKKRLADAAGVDKRKIIITLLAILFACAFLILMYFAI